MPTSPLISVIVPVYNVERYLRKCLDSICCQTYRNLEILCVNDGSTDGSATILEEYAAKDSRIKVFTQANAGLSAARNTGLNHATGEWITGVDSDDYLEKDTIEYALAGAAEHSDIVFFGTQCIWENEPQQNKLQDNFNLKYNGVQEVSTELIQNSPVIFCSKLWRKSLIDRFNCRFPKGLLYEDTFFFFALAPFARHISYMPDMKYMYIQRQDSIMGETRAKSPRSLDRLHIAKHTLDFYESHPLPAHLQELRLTAFIANFLSNIRILPDGLYEAYINMAREIATQYKLLAQYKSRLRFLQCPPWWLKPFVRHTISKSYYGLPGIPFITIIRHKDKEIIRFLGIRIRVSGYQQHG